MYMCILKSIEILLPLFSDRKLKKKIKEAEYTFMKGNNRQTNK